MKEYKAYCFAVGNLAGTIPGSFSRKHFKDTKKFLNYCKKLDGFLGIHPEAPRGTMIIFKTENDAKRAKNLIESDLKVQTGNFVVPVFIPEEYVK